MRKFFDKLMNAFGKSNKKGTKRNLQLEPLEERQLLSVNPINPMGDSVCDPVVNSNLVASAEADASTGTVNRNIYLDFSNVTGNGYYYMKVDANGVDFKDAQITNITDGQPTTDGIANYGYHDKYSGNTDLIIVQLNGGAKYKVSFTDANNAATSGQVGTLSVSLGLIGDQAADTLGGDEDRLVSEKEANYVTGALNVQFLQSRPGMSGPGYQSHEQILDSYGLTYTDFANNFNKFDFNLNGTIDENDYSMAKANTQVTGTWSMTDDDKAPAFEGVVNLGNSVNGKFYVEDSTVDGTVNNNYFGNPDSPNTYADSATSGNAYAEFKDISTLQVAQVVLKNGENDLITIDFKSDEYKDFFYQTSTADADGYYGYRFDLSAFDRYTGEKTDITSAVFTLKDDADNEVEQKIEFKITGEAIVPQIYNPGETTEPTPVDTKIDPENPSSSAVPQAGSSTPINLSQLISSDDKHIITVPGENEGEEYPDAETLIYAIKDPASCVYKSLEDDSVITDITGKELGKDYYVVYTSTEKTATFDKTGEIVASDTEGARSITYTYSVTSSGDLSFVILNDSAKWLSTYENADQDWTKAALPTTVWVTNSFNYAQNPVVDEANGWSTGTFNMSLVPANDAPTAVADPDGTLDAAANATGTFDLLANDTDPDASDTKTITKINETALESDPIYFTLSVADTTSGVYSLVAAESSITSGIKMQLDLEGKLKVDLIGNPFDFLAKETTVNLEFNYTMADNADAASSAKATIAVTNTENAKPVANGKTDISWTENTADQTASLTASDSNVGDAFNDGDTLTASLVDNSFTIAAELNDVEYTASYDAVNGWQVDGTIPDVPSAEQTTFFNRLIAIGENWKSIITFADTEYTISKAQDKTAPAFDLNFINGTYFDFLVSGETATINFNWNVNDGTVDSENATVTISVTGENDAPVLADSSESLKEFNLGTGKSFTYSIQELKVAELLADADISDVLSFAGVVSTLDTDQSGKVTITGTGDYAAYKNVIEISFNDNNDEVTLNVADYDNADSFLKWGLAYGEKATLQLKVSVKDDSGTNNDTSETKTYTFTFIGKNDAPVIADGQSVSLSIDLALEDDGSLKSTDAIKIQLDKDAAVAESSTIIPGSSFSFIYKGTTYESTETFENESAQKVIYDAITEALNLYDTAFKIGADGTISVSDTDDNNDGNEFVNAIKAIYTANIEEEVKNLTNITFKAANVSVTDSNSQNTTATVDINVVEKLPPVVEGTAELTTTNENTDPAEIDLADYFTVSQAADDQTSTRTDWYKYADVKYESATFTASTNTPEKADYVTDFITNELTDALTGKISITEAGVVSLDITDDAGNIFDFLDEGSSISMSFSAKIYDKEYSVYSKVTFEVNVTGVSDAVKNADVTATINDVFTEGTNVSTLGSVSFEFADKLFDLIDWAGNAARYDVAFGEISQDETSKSNVYTFTAEELATIKGLLVINADSSVSAKSAEDAAEISAILQKIPADSSVVLTWNLIATNKTDAAEVITSTIAIKVMGTNQAPTAALNGDSTDANAMKEKGWTVTSAVTGETPKSADIAVTEGAESYTTSDTATLFTIADIDERDTWSIVFVKQVSPTETFDDSHIPSYNDSDLITVDTDGKVTFNIGDKFNELRTGESVVFTYNYTVTDGKGSTAEGTFTLTVNGKDTVPTVDSSISNLTAELNDLNDSSVNVVYSNPDTSGNVDSNAGFSNIQEETFELNSITVSDVKVGESETIDDSSIIDWLGITNADLDNLTFDANDLKLDLTAISAKLQKLNKDQTLTYTITYGVKYGEIASTETQSIAVTVNGTNQVPTATGIHDATETLPTGWSIESDAVTDKVSKVSVVEGTEESYTTSYKSFGSSDIDYNDVYKITLVATADENDDVELTITVDDADADAATARKAKIVSDIDNLIGEKSPLEFIADMITDGVEDTQGNSVQTISVKDIDFSFLREGESISFEVGYHLYNETDYNPVPDGTFTFEIKGKATAPEAPKYTFEVLDTVSGTDTETPADINAEITEKDVEDLSLTYSINGTESITFKIYDPVSSDYEDATEGQILELIKAESVTWGDVLKVNEEGAFVYNGEQLKWLAKDTKIQITWSIKATSENQLSTDGTYTLNVTGTSTDLEIEAGQDVLLVTAIAPETYGDYEDFIKGETFKYSCDKGSESSYTFTATDSVNIKLANNGDGTVTVYVHKDAVTSTGTYAPPTDELSKTYSDLGITIAKDGENDTSSFDLVVTTKSAPAVNAVPTVSGTENGENISVVIKASDPDEMDITGGWSFADITEGNITDIAGTTGATFTAAEILAAISKVDQAGNTNGTITIDMTKFDKLEADKKLTFTLNYTVKDNQFNLETSKTLGVTITGVNDNPTAESTTTASDGVHNSVGIDIATLATNAGFDDHDFGDSVNTDKIMVLGFATEDATEEASYIDLTATSEVWIASNEGRIKATLAEDKITLDYTDKYYALKASDSAPSEILNVKFYDQNDATTGAVAVTVTVNGDYVAPEFTADVYNLIGTVGGDSTKAAGKTNKIIFYLAEQISDTFKNTENLVFTVKLNGVDVNTLTVLPDIFDSISYVSATQTLEIDFIDQGDYTELLDLSGVTFDITVKDSKVADQTPDASTIKVELAESNVVELAVIPAKNTSQGYEGVYAVREDPTDEESKILFKYITGEAFDALEDNVKPSEITGKYVNLDIWLRDNSDNYFSYADKVGENYTVASVQFMIKYDPGLVSVATFSLGNQGVSTSGINKIMLDSATAIKAGYITVTYKFDGGKYDYLGTGNTTGINPGISNRTGLYLGRLRLTLSEGNDATDFVFEFSEVKKDGINDNLFNTSYESEKGYSLYRGISNGSGGTQKYDNNIDSKQLSIVNGYPKYSSLNGIGQSEAIVDGGIYVRTVADATETDANGKVEQLGTNADYVSEWDSFYSEIWVKAEDGMQKTSVDFAFDSSLFQATEVTFGSAIKDGTFKINNDGTITGISGNFAGKVTSDGYYLLAKVKMEAVDKGGIDFADSNSPKSIGIELSNGSMTRFDGSVADVYLGKTSTTEVWAVAYDMNDDGAVTGSDFDAFYQYYGMNSFGNVVISMFDYNSDGAVTGSDFDAFYALYGVTQSKVTSGQYKLVYANNFNQRYTGSTLQTEEDSAWVGVVLDAAQDAWSEIIPDTDVNVTIFVKDLGGDDLAVSTSIPQTDGSIEGVIYLDDDAMGNTWYAGLDSDVEGSSKYDLYTVLLHELGHIYGYEHVAEESDLMYETLTPGTRKTLDDCSALNAVESENALIVETSIAEELGDVEESVAPEAFNACLILENQENISASKKDIADLKAAGISINNIQPKVDAEDLAAAILSNDGIDENDDFEILGSANVSNNDLALSSLLNEEEKEDLI